MRRLLLYLFLLGSLAAAHGGPRDALWKKVADAESRGLPRTAITNLEPILQGALHDRAYAEATKAVGEKITLEGQIQGSKPEEKITRLEAEIPKAPREMTPVLEALLAEWYWEYFRENSWRFMQRTATEEQPGKDFTTWSLPRLFATIDAHFQKALSAEAVLKATPIQEWNDLLPRGTMPDAYRPTLYDFIVSQALAFYSSGEQAGARPETFFELSADSPALDGVEKFLAWQPEGDASEPALRALRLYQELLRFHQKDPAPQPAFAAADVDRLTWAWNLAVGENKNARYTAALESLEGGLQDEGVLALALEREARVWQQEKDLLKAHTLAQRGAHLPQDSPGRKLCRNLVAEIEAKSVNLTTERVWNCFQNGSAKAGSPCPVVTVGYRNVTLAYFRAIPYNWETFLEKRHHRPEGLDDAEKREVLSRKPAQEWSHTLPPTTNYAEASIDLPAPGGLKPGFYFIAASHNAGFTEKANEVSLAPVWVSDLALVMRQGQGQGHFGGFVLDANSGEPLADAEVSVWHLDNQGNRVPDPALRTDENGQFTMQPNENRSYLFRARYQGRELATSGDWMNFGRSQPIRPSGQTIFFTDRTLYRPGQTIQYKGICVWVDQEKDNYELLKGEELAVVFRDGNGKEVARQHQRANDYGSFSGSFTAPRDRLMGNMYLEVQESQALGRAYFRVEEYKRPKFQVTLDAPKIGVRLNEKVTLTGHALAYTGAAIDGGKVTYHIVRETRMPWWWGWWGRPRQMESQEIAHGAGLTEADGTFPIQFVTRPDDKVPEKDEPTFEFRVTADVTDNAGETRSAEQILRVGYTALEAKLTAEDWQVKSKPIFVQVETKTLDGEPQVTQGSVKLYSLKAPDETQRAPLQQQYPWMFGGWRARFVPYIRPEPPLTNDLSNPINWPLDRVLVEEKFTTDTNGLAKLSFKLEPGAYRAVLETQDRFGKKVGGKLPLEVLDPEDTRLKIKVPNLVAAPEWEAQPGEDFMAIWGTGYEQGRAFVEIEHRGQMVASYWTKPGQTQQQIRWPVTEEFRGGFTLHVTQVRDNRAYVESRRVTVPWKNKELALKWTHFVSKLLPGQKETWGLEIKPAHPAAGASGKAETTAAELAATLYDESLDAFQPHNWTHQFGFFREDYSYLRSEFQNAELPFYPVWSTWNPEFEPVEISYRTFPPEWSTPATYYADRFARGDAVNSPAVQGLGARGMSLLNGRAVMPASPMASAAAGEPQDFPMDFGTRSAKMKLNLGEAEQVEGFGGVGGGGGARARTPSRPRPNLDLVSARQNLNETAFFYPQLTADSNGVVQMTFTMPEALTKWHFMGFAHDGSVRSGFLEGHAVTAKDLMVQPNPPRFLREGDMVEFTVKVSNQSDTRQSGSVRLTFTQAANGESADKLLGLRETEQSFDLPAKESRSYSWRLSVPDGCGYLTYKAVAASDSVSDGEEGAVPVLARRILVTESLPLPMRGRGTKKFEFTKLLKSGGSKTLRNEGLTVQMVSHPAWYAVLALPYLMEYEYECSEQTFNRYYANCLARHIANGDPKIRRVFDQWKGLPALDSPLEKNQELKSVMIEETPWLRDAESESQARRNVGILFDANRLDNESEATLRKLAEMQLPDGSWPWFPGGRGNDYITLYIMTGFGRLRHLGVPGDMGPALRSLNRLDDWMEEEYVEIQKWKNPEEYTPSSTIGLYLYGRSFFLKDQPIKGSHQRALEFFLRQARKKWLETGCRQTQAHLALALQRFAAAAGATDRTPRAIMDSLKERSVTDDELGRFWRDTEESWWWYRAPIETQALMIEAFDEVAGDAAVVEECRVWLLKQKQTQDWRTTKATADAVYALLLRGKDLLSSSALVEVKLGGVDVTDAVRKQTPAPNGQNSPFEPGTGFYEYRFAPADIKPKLGDITVRKTDDGVAWGSVHWQYLEDMSKVTPYAGTPLKLSKKVYVKKMSGNGASLEELKGPVLVGDELVTRVVLRTDRDMEFVHLKDQRGSGTEPVNVLSGYKYQDGLAYYESTRDTASHFFIDYLPKGTYVFEYSSRAQLRGQYQSGIAEIQCLYAPEFNSHSESVMLEVK